MDYRIVFFEAAAVVQPLSSRMVDWLLLTGKMQGGQICDDVFIDPAYIDEIRTELSAAGMVEECRVLH